MSREDISNFTLEEGLAMWTAWIEGTWGELGRAERDYVSFCATHNMNQTLIMANSKKGKKPQKPPTFKEFAPRLNAFAFGDIEPQTQTLQEKILTQFQAIQ